MSAEMNRQPGIVEIDQTNDFNRCRIMSEVSEWA